MKRLRAALLALVMAVSCCVPALAVEEQPDYAALQAQLDALYEQIRPLEEKLNELYTQANEVEEQLAYQYVGYYETYGDMSEWDDEMWATAEGWSETEWHGYWLGESARAEENGENWDWMAQRKESMGMYFPTGTNVRVNGAYLPVAPVMSGGASYLPAEVLLEAMGLESTEVATVELDGVACLPIRKVAKAAGWEVDWDDWYAVVSVDNWEALAEDIDREFTSLNAILKASMNTLEKDKTYHETEQVTLSAVLYGDGKQDKASLKMDVDALVKGDGSALAMDCTLGTDLKDLADVFTALGGQEELAELEALNGGKVSLRMDGAQGGLYMKSDVWGKLGVDYLPDNKWLGMESAEFGAAYTQLLNMVSQGYTVGSLLTAVVRQDYQPYDTLEDILPVFRLLVADDAFTVKRTGSTTTYTCEQSMVKLVTRAAQMGLFTAEDLGSLFGETGIPTGSFTLTAKVAGEKLSAMSVKGKLHWSLIDLELDMESTQSVSKCYWAAKGRWLGKVEMTAQAKVEQTQRSIPGAPDTFLSYEDVLADYYGSMLDW